EDKQEILRHIAFAEPVSPRKLDWAIPAELETVVLKALAKSPDERYLSAGELAKDLQRFLEDRPILARRPTVRQRLDKLVRRHPGTVTASLAGLLLVAVAAAASTALIYREQQQTHQAYGQAAHERDEAIKQRDRADQNLEKALQAVEQYLTTVAEDR